MPRLVTYLRSPQVQAALYLLGVICLWTLLCAVSHKAPDLDGMEELVWASSLELGYLKHPPFPSWVMYGLTHIFGRTVWLSFLGGQLFSALALCFVWLLAREFVSPRKAFIVVLFTSTSIYFSLRGTIYNHNTAQLWSLAAATWLFYRALRFQRTWTWVLLGAVSAVATMTKYSAFIQFAAFFAFMLRQGRWKEMHAIKGMIWATTAFLVVLAPHLYWLVMNSFGPLRYADGSLDTLGHMDAIRAILHFCLDQLARLSPLLLIWSAWRYWCHTRPSAAQRTSDNTMPSYAAALSAWDRSFLLWVGLFPVISTVLLSMLLGTRLEASWGTTFFTLFGFYALWWMRGDEQVNLKRIAILVIGLQIVMALAYAAARGPLAWYSGRDTRSMFPGPAIAEQMNGIWDKHVPGVPLRLVASDTWLGGNIAVNSDAEVDVFINGRLDESPWLDPDTVLDCGVLVVYSRKTKGEPHANLQRLFEQASWHGVTALPWSSEHSPVIDLNWAIVPPLATCAGPMAARP